MIVNISGLSGSGKTTLVAYLLDNHPSMYSKLVSYTNRKKRVREIDGFDYNFVPQNFIFNKEDFILKRERLDGTYAVKIEDLHAKEGRILLTTFPPKGVVILENFGFNVRPFFLFVDKIERRKRMMSRGDNPSDIESRLIFDEQEYSLEDNKTIINSKLFSVLDGNVSVAKIAYLLHNTLILDGF